jgi:hypothetical protein
MGEGLDVVWSSSLLLLLLLLLLFVLGGMGACCSRPGARCKVGGSGNAVEDVGVAMLVEGVYIETGLKPWLARGAARSLTCGARPEGVPPCPEDIIPADIGKIILKMIVLENRRVLESEFSKASSRK